MADQSGKVGTIYIEAEVIPRVNEGKLREAGDRVQAGIEGGGGGGARAPRGSALRAAQVRLDAAEARVEADRIAEKQVYMAAGGMTGLSAIQQKSFLTRGTMMQAAENESYQRTAVQGAIAASRFNLGMMNRVERNWDAASLAQQKQFEAAGTRVQNAWDAASLAQYKSQERESVRDAAEIAGARTAFRRAEVAIDKAEQREALQSFRRARREMAASESASARADAALSSYADPIDLGSAVRDAERKGSAANKLETEMAEQRRRNSGLAGFGRSAYSLGQTDVLGTGMLMQMMFGGWEISTSAQASQNIRRLSNRPTPEGLKELQSNIDRMKQGVLMSPYAMLETSMDAMGYQSPSEWTRKVIESANVSTVQTMGKASATGIRMSYENAAISAHRQAEQVATLDLYESKRMAIENDRYEVRRKFAAESVALNLMAAQVGDDPIARAKMDAQVREFNETQRIALMEADKKYEGGMNRLKNESAREIRNIVASLPAMALAANGQFGDYNRAQMQVDIEQGIANAPAIFEPYLRQQGAARLAMDQAQGVFNARARAFTGVASAMGGSGMGLAGNLVLSESRRLADLATSRPEERNAINYAAQIEQQNIFRQSSLRTSAMTADNQSLRYLLAGRPTDAEANQVVSRTLGSLPGLDNARQRSLAIESAKLQIDLLTQAQPISGGTPGLFVGAAGPAFDPGKFKGQLAAGVAADAAIQGITSGLNSGQPGSTGTDTLLQQIRDILNRAFP